MLEKSLHTACLLDEMAEPEKTVHSVIIANKSDPKLKRAISMVPSINFCRFAVAFKLAKGA